MVYYLVELSSTSDLTYRDFYQGRVGYKSMSLMIKMYWDIEWTKKVNKTTKLTQKEFSKKKMKYLVKYPVPTGLWDYKKIWKVKDVSVSKEEKEEESKVDT